MKIEDFFEGMSKVASTVNLVTTDGPAGKGGITVSAMASVTAEPPTLLICIHDDSPSCELIKTNRRFCVNVLKSDQVELSEAFAGRVEFDELAHLESELWTNSAEGSPILNEALASFDCALSQYMKVGSHSVFFGEIRGINLSDGRALVYVNRDYDSIIK
jgi:flavin reductase